MRTTVELNDLVYKKIVDTYGKRRISETVNDILFRYFFKQDQKDMFGADPWLKKTGTKGLRDEYDRDL
jgi:hypothetical protein